jgi:hypothetical protein
VHHDRPRPALTLCCVHAGDRPQHKPQSQPRNIILAATCSVLCATAHKTDAATGEHGDLLDLIALNRDLHRLGEAMIEARFVCASSVPSPERAAQRPSRAAICRRRRAAAGLSQKVDEPPP